MSVRKQNQRFFWISPRIVTAEFRLISLHARHLYLHVHAVAMGTQVVAVRAFLKLGMGLGGWREKT